MRILTFAIVVVTGCGTPGAAPVRTPAPSRTEPAVDPGDLCPSEPEDVDGFEDGDGCPDPDNDQDRIRDADDTCPNDPETYNGHDDTDGCPDHGCVIVRNHPTCILERMFFTRNTVVPTPTSEPILDAIARAMTELGPDIELVELRGHRVAGERAAVSNQRAASVHRLLVGRGVDAARLSISDGGIADTAHVAFEIVKQRVSFDEADEIACTPMGRFYIKLDEAQKQARCQ